MTGLPRNYDAWRLRGPEEEHSVITEACDECRGLGRKKWLDADGEYDCPECDGTGEVETTIDEPDGDYLFERARDARMEDGQ
jgi:hypothetical protein